MPALLFNDVTLLDATGRDPVPHTSVLCESRGGIGASSSSSGATGIVGIFRASWALAAFHSSSVSSSSASR